MYIYISEKFIGPYKVLLVLGRRTEYCSFDFLIASLNEECLNISIIPSTQGYSSI